MVHTSATECYPSSSYLDFIPWAVNYEHEVQRYSQPTAPKHEVDSLPPEVFTPKGFLSSNDTMPNHATRTDTRRLELKDNSQFTSCLAGTASDPTPQQMPKGPRRGPFLDIILRRQTAETRKIGSCIRCAMQRIRVSLQERRGLWGRRSESGKLTPVSARAIPKTQRVSV